MLVASPHKKFSELNSILLGRAVAKLYRSATLKDIKFDNNILLHEDNLYSYDVYLKSKSVSVIEDALYIVTYNISSVTRSGNVKYGA